MTHDSSLSTSSDQRTPNRSAGETVQHLLGFQEAEPEPDFALSGKLAAESNKVNGVVLVYNEPAESAAPQARWRLYQFKKGEPFQVAPFPRPYLKTGSVRALAETT